MNAYLEVLGRFHPLVLHVPVGTLVALVVLELLSALRRAPLPRGFAGTLVALTALSAAAASGSGWLLGESPDYGSSDVIFWHRWLGVALAATSVLFALAFAAGATRTYRVLLAAAAVLMFPVGHYGATMTHGRDFLFEPLRERPERRPARGTEPPLAVAPTSDGADVVAQTVAPAEPVNEAVAVEPEPDAWTYASHVVPVLEGKCVACHGADKQKGGFALHTIEAIEAAASEIPLFVPDPPFGPALIERMDLPLDDPDHMPPEGKPQLDPAEMAVLRAWVAAGAPFEGEFAAAGAAPAQESGSEPASEETPDESAAAPPAPPRGDLHAPPDPAALAALGAAFVHVERLGGENDGLWIDFAAVAVNTGDEEAARLLEPLAPHVTELDLARAEVGARTLALCARMPRLASLDLRACGLDDTELAALAGQASLRELTLAQNELESASVDVLLSLPALERVFLWSSGLGKDDLARLREERPALTVDDGTRADADVLEEEPEVHFTRPGEPAADVATTDTAPAPRAANALCPVSGSPVDPRYGALYEGKLIGFCCPNCPKQFWDDPASFAAKLD